MTQNEPFGNIEPLEPTAPAPAFDYATLDAQTAADLELAEHEYLQGKKIAEAGLRRMAGAVAIAHDALCGSCDIMSQLKHGNRGENSFGAWCESMDINRKAAERLLQVNKLFEDSSPKQQRLLEELAPTLLYAAAKPSAPAELVQGVKNGDITTNKQFQDQLKEMQRQLAAEKQRADKAEQGVNAAEARAQQIEADAAEITRQLDTARAAAANANARVKELEARPVEVVGVAPDEIDRRAAAMAAEAGADLRRQLSEAAAENDALRKRANDLDAEAERYAGQLGEAHMDILDLKDALAAAQNAAAPDPFKQAQRAIEICNYTLIPLVSLCTEADVDTALPIRALLLDFINNLYDAAELDAEPQDET